MINFINIYEYKRKFATLICKLYYSAGISLEHINDELVFGNKFVYFENNHIELFMQKQYEELSKEMFNTQLKYNSNEEGAIYWAAIQIMNIAINYDMPLKQVLLLCPLQEMVAYFEIYHEMNSIELYKNFINKEAKRSVLREIRMHNNYTQGDVASLTDIPLSTIKYLEKNNENIYNASFDKITKIMHSLGINDILLFMRHSNFVPVSEFLFESEEFLEQFKKRINNYYRLNDGIIEIAVNKDADRKKDNILCINYVNELIIGKKRILIEDKTLLLLIKQAIEDVLNRNNNNELWF